MQGKADAEPETESTSAEWDDGDEDSTNDADEAVAERITRFSEEMIQSDQDESAKPIVVESESEKEKERKISNGGSETIPSTSPTTTPLSKCDAECLMTSFRSMITATTIEDLQTHELASRAHLASNYSKLSGSIGQERRAKPLV